MDVWVLVCEDDSMPYEYRASVVGVYASPEAAQAALPAAYRWRHWQREDVDWWEASIRDSNQTYDLTRYPVNGLSPAAPVSAE